MMLEINNTSHLVPTEDELGGVAKKYKIVTIGKKIRKSIELNSMIPNKAFE